MSLDWLSEALKYSYIYIRAFFARVAVKRIVFLNPYPKRAENLLLLVGCGCIVVGWEGIEFLGTVTQELLEKLFKMFF